MRPAPPRRHGAGDRLQHRSRRSGAELRGAGLRMAACRRSQRRLRRQAGERRGGRGDPRPRSTFPVQLGGGIRDLAADRGLAREGRRARRSSAPWRCAIPTLVQGGVQASRRIAVGIDARGGKVAIEGWAETSELGARSGARFEDAGVAAIIYTDIDRDGVLAGLNLDATFSPGDLDPGHRLAAGSPRSTTARACFGRTMRSRGAIAGRALYDGRLRSCRGAGAASRGRKPIA